MTRRQRLEATLRWHTGKHNKLSSTSSTKLLVIGKSNYVHAWRRSYISLNICLNKTGFLQRHRLFSEPPTVYRGKRVMFCVIFAAANKVSNSEETRKVEYVFNFWKCADAVHPKLSKSVHPWRNYSLPNLARFLRHCVVIDAIVWIGSTLLTSYDVMKSRGEVTSMTPRSRDTTSYVKRLPCSSSVFQRRDVTDNLFTWSAGSQSTSQMTPCDGETSWVTSPYRHYY